jgi:hypothetical protein
MYGAIYQERMGHPPQGGAMNVVINTTDPQTGINGLPVGPSVIAGSSPLSDPVFEPNFNYEIRGNLPEGLPGAGTTYHLLLNVGGTAQAPVITSAKIHTDIGSPGSVGGLLKHAFGDVIWGSLITAVNRGCVIKFD